MTEDSIPVRPLSKSEMRELFHECQLLQKIESKELTAVLLRDRHSNPAKSGQIFCTHSQIVTYVDDAQDEIVRVHQYKRPDGTIGGSGLPDPIRIFIGGVICKLKTKD